MLPAALYRDKRLRQETSLDNNRYRDDHPRSSGRMKGNGPALSYLNYITESRSLTHAMFRLSKSVIAS
jgi:hypothetical protein